MQGSCQPKGLSADALSSYIQSMGERVTRSELARRRGVSQQAIGYMVKRGVVPVGDDGLIDFDEAQAALAARGEPPRGGNHPAKKSPKPITNAAKAAVLPSLDESGEPMTLAKAQLKIALLDIQKKELEIAKTRREFVSVMEVVKQIERHIGDARSAFLNIPSAIAQDLAVANTPAECKDIVQKAVHEALEELSAAQGEIETAVSGE